MTRCGYQTGQIFDPERTDWDGAGPRPIRWSAWYPTRSAAKAPPQSPNQSPNQSPLAQMFELGALQLDAPLPRQRCPVVLMSHGTGGTPESLGWLARALALRGMIVLGAGHHGNTGGERYRPEGFLCWWERSADLTALLTALSGLPDFADALDLGRVSALGFSLGGPTVLALLGARYDMARYMAWRARTPRLPGGPREFPDLAAEGARLAGQNGPFRRAWQAHGRALSDPRVARAIAIAHAPVAEAFTPESLAAITRPVTLITGGADAEAPAAQGTGVLLRHNPRFRHFEVDRRAGHYTFLGLPAPGAREGAPELFSDAPGVDRALVHGICLRHVLEALSSVNET